MSSQTTVEVQQSKVRGRPFVKGQSGNPAGRPGKLALIAEQTARLLAHHGRPLLPTELELIEQLAAVKLARPRTASDIIRQANTVRRLMSALYGRATPLTSSAWPSGHQMMTALKGEAGHD